MNQKRSHAHHNNNTTAREAGENNEWHSIYFSKNLQISRSCISPLILNIHANLTSKSMVSLPPIRTESVVMIIRIFIRVPLCLHLLLEIPYPSPSDIMFSFVVWCTEFRVFDRHPGGIFKMMFKVIFSVES
jgi:hypothetical protein